MQSSQDAEEVRGVLVTLWAIILPLNNRVTEFGSGNLVLDGFFCYLSWDFFLGVNFRGIAFIARILRAYPVEVVVSLIHQQNF